MVTDGETAIPLDQMLWTSEEYNPENHTKKWELAQSLIKKITPLIGIKMVVLDGLYAVTAFIKWLIKKSIFFEMRLHSNRVVICKGTKAQIRHHKSLKVTGKNPLRTLKVVWNDIELYATVIRRLMKNGDFSIVYQIANYKAPAWRHLQNYGYRWNIEKFFRTAKQHLGLNDCMARKQERQESHIMGVFLAYTFAQLERIQLRLDTVEIAIKSLKRFDFDSLSYRFKRSGRIFGHA